MGHVKLVTSRINFHPQSCECGRRNHMRGEEDGGVIAIIDCPRLDESILRSVVIMYGTHGLGVQSQRVGRSRPDKSLCSARCLLAMLKPRLGF